MNTLEPLKINGSSFKNLATNLRRLLKEHQVSESEVALSLNIPVMTIRRLVSGETIDPRISTLKLIANYFQVSVDLLVEDNNLNSVALMSKTIPQFVPILDWKTLIGIHSIEDIDLRLWKEWYPIIFGNQSTISNHAFALESRPSMQPRFPIGTLFIIDPNETPTDGDIVLIKLKTNGDLSLRELIIDLPRWQLQPVVAGSEGFFYDNKQHIIVGVVVLTMLHTRKEKISN